MSIAATSLVSTHFCHVVNMHKCVFLLLFYESCFTVIVKRSIYNVAYLISYIICIVVSSVLSQAIALPKVAIITHSFQDYILHIIAEVQAASNYYDMIILNIEKTKSSKDTIWNNKFQCF